MSSDTSLRFVHRSNAHNQQKMKYLFHGYATGFGKDTMLLIFEDYRAKMMASAGSATPYFR